MVQDWNTFPPSQQNAPLAGAATIGHPAGETSDRSFTMMMKLSACGEQSERAILTWS